MSRVRVETPAERVAVLDREGLHVEGAWSDQWATQATLARLLEVCRAQKVTQLWVHESAETEREEWEQARGAGWNLPEVMRPWQNTWQPGTYGRVALVLPALEHRTAWNRATSGAELLEAILAFRRAVGISYRSSPGATGQALMRECAPRIDFTASLAPAEMPEPAKGNTESDFLWMRALTAEERGMRYVHAFDKNWAYCAALSGLKLGFGKPEWTPACDLEGLHMEHPAYWKVICGPGPEIEPQPFPRNQWTWMTSPTFTAARDFGDNPDVDGAWVYPEAHEPLTPWARRVRAARKELMHSNPIAYQVLKDSYRWAIGWFNYRGIKDSEEPEDLYRPDWRHAIIATARANMYRNAAKAYRASGHAPFAIATDCLYYASDEMHAELFGVNTLGLRLGANVGEYKFQTTAGLDSVRDCIEIGGGRGLKALRERLSGWKREEAGHDGDSDREVTGE